VTALEHVTVVIPTRDRGALVASAIRSILANTATAFDLVVVDQSESDATEAAVAEFRTDARLQYIRSASRGISAGRNIGNRTARGTIIANTDDDCRVPTDWIEQIRRTFRQHPGAAIALGCVSAAPHPTDGFIPAYAVKKPVLVHHIRHKHRVEGIGACFAHRLDVWRDVGGFDELLGAGARFPAAEEGDFVTRALAKGYGVCETTMFGVVHHGFRRWDQSHELIGGYLRGIGAMSAKHLRLNPGSYPWVLTHLAARWAWGRPIVDLGHTPDRLLRLRAFLDGFREGFRLPVDRHGCFVAQVDDVGAR